MTKVNPGFNKKEVAYLGKGDCIVVIDISY